MEDEQIMQEMTKVLQEKLEIDLTKVDMEQKFWELGVNSLQYVQMLVLFENEFDIEFDEEYLNINTLYNFNRIKDYIKEKTN